MWKPVTCARLAEARGLGFGARPLLAAAAVLVVGGCSLVSRAPPPARIPSGAGVTASGAIVPVPDASVQMPDVHVAVPDAAGSAIASTAAQLIGTPYHFGGADERGFDCSGLAVYAHERAGLEIPRTANEQRRAARPVALDDLEPGDLVFFRIRHRHMRRSVDHVGIYTGDGRFIHAPSSGGVVSYGNLNDDYFRKRLAGAGRFWGATATAEPVEAQAPSPH